MKTLSKLLPFILLGSLFMGGCKKDADPVNEEELITTLTMTWTPVGGGAPVIFQFKDLDGEGGNAPVITSAPLAANTTYGVSIVALNESVSPAEDITEEIEEEGTKHQFFFATSAGVNLSFSYQDSDINGAPIGLVTNMLTGAVSSGTLQVTLRHDLNKGAAGVPQGDITNAGGDTDIEVEFDIVTQ